MATSLYQVISQGTTRAGFTRDQVKQNLKQHLKLNDKAIDALLAEGRTVIKRNLTLDNVLHYEQKFFHQGLIVKHEVMTKRTAAQFTIDDSDRPTFAKEVDRANQYQQPVEEPSAVLHKGSSADFNEEPSASVNKESSVSSNAELSAAVVKTKPAVPAENDLSQPRSPDTTMPSDLSIASNTDDYPKVMPFQFTGNGWEYFKIWIVNIVLTILTLGIYSAWAKVRNKQYFYGNTSLDGASFEYTAKPLQILKGRLLAFLFIAIYVLCEAFLPPFYLLYFYGAVALIFIFIFPWVVVNGLQFNARHSNYRNINFAFHGTYWGAFKAFILWPLASLTLILIPFSWHRQNHFFVNNSRYGTAAFQFAATVKDYYKIFGMMIGLGLGIGILVAVFSAAAQSISVVVVMGIIYLLAGFLLNAYYTCLTNNLMYNSSLLNEHNLTSDYDVKSYLVLLVTNTLGIIVTLGLFIPWAMVRSAHYHAQKTSLIATEDLNGFVAAQAQQVNTLAEGLADTHDLFDIGVGI